MDKKVAFLLYLKERETAVLEDAARLAAEDRKDESNLLKARATIYGILKSLYGAAEKVSGPEETAIAADFLDRATNIPAMWRSAMELARSHGDAKRVAVEEAKLAAVDESVAEFRRIFEVQE